MSSNQQPPNLLYPVANAVSSSNPFVEKFSTRDPTTADVNYPVQKRWFNTTDDTEWILIGFISTGGVLQAQWRLMANAAALLEFTGGTGTAGTFPVVPNVSGEVQLSSSDSTILITGSLNALDFVTNGASVTESFTVDSVTAPGVNPVTPSGGIVTVGGGVVAAHSVPIETRTRALNEYKIEAQYASAVAATDGTQVGLAAFDSSQFSVDANGFVSLAGGTGAVDSIGVDATSGTGTNPVLPTALGLITVNGAVVAANSTPIRTVSTLPNTYQIQAQYSSAINATDGTKVGVCAFNDDYFTVDATGFVSATAALTTDLHWPKFIVGDTANGANYSTIAAAYAAASANDVIGIQPGSYTEDLTVAKDVNFVGLSPVGRGSTGSVIITGKFTFSTNSVRSYMANLTFVQNGSNMFEISGDSVTVQTAYCLLSCGGQIGIAITGSTCNFYLSECNINIANGGTLFSNSNDSSIWLNECVSLDVVTPATSKLTTDSAVLVKGSRLQIPFEIQAAQTGIIYISNSYIGSNTNTTYIILGGTSSAYVYNSYFFSGNLPAITIATGCTGFIANNVIDSSAANVFTGAGTINTGGNVCIQSAGNSVSTINSLTTI